MNNMIKFYVCNKPATERSCKSWWSNYKTLWGHKNASECGRDSILVPQADYDNLISFAYKHPLDRNKTYQMDITCVKNLFFWRLLYAFEF